MIKSKFSKINIGGYTTLSFLLLISDILLLIQHFGGHYFFQNNPESINETLFIVTGMAVFLIPHNIYIWLTLKSILIDKSKKSICFSKLLTGKTIEYSFEDLDGYSKSEVSFRSGKTKVLNLIKKNKKVEIISDLRYSNFNDLINGLSSLKDVSKKIS